MKLGQVVLENYGIYSRHEFRFDAAPLVLVFGKNGSGKTTALNGLRQALFGFPLRNPYSTTRKMRASVDGTMESGESLSFVRIKGRPDSIEGRLGTRSLEDSLLEQALCNLDLKGYEQLFGFSLDELRSGEETLKNSRLAEAFAGGSLSGIKALQSLQNELDASLDQLYRPRRTTSQIHRLLTELGEHASSLQQLQSKRSDVEALVEQKKQLQTERAKLTSQRDQLQKSLTHAQNLCTALPRFQELQQLKKALAAIDIPDGVDMGLVARWGDYTDELTKITSQLEEVSQRKKLLKEKLSSSADTFDWSDLETQVEQLGHQAAEIEMTRTKLVDLLEQHQEARDIADRSLQVIGQLGSKDELLANKVNTSEAEDIERLSAENERLKKLLNEEQAKLDSVRENLAGLSSSQRDRIDFDLTTLQQNADSLRNALSEAVRLKTELARFNSKRTKYETAEWLLSQMTPRQGTLLAENKSLDEDWALPLRSEIEPVVKKIAEAKQQKTLLADQKKELEKQLDQAKPSQEKDVEAAKTPERSTDELETELLGLQKRRDELISNWLDDLSQPLLAATIPVDLQIETLQKLEEINARCDQLQILLRPVATSESDSATAAVSQQLLKQIVQCDQKITQVEEELETATKSYEQLFQTLPFQPISISEINRWIEHYDSWRNDELRERELRKHLQSVRSVAKSFRNKIIDLWPQGVSDSVENRVLIEQIKQWTEFNRNFEQQKSLRDDLQQQCDQHSRRCSTLKAELAEVESEFNAWKATLPVKADMRLENAAHWLRQVSIFYRENRSAERFQEQATSAKSKVTTFDTAVNQLKIELTRRETKDFTAEDQQEQSELLAREWLQRLHATRDRQKEHIRLRSELAHVGESASELDKKRTELSKKIEALGNSEEHHTDLITRVRDAERIRKSIDESNAALEPYCGKLTLEQLVGELEARTEVEVHENLRIIKEQLSEAERRRDEVTEELGSIDERVEQLANNHASMSKLQLIHGKRLELADLSDQWIIQRIAQELLNRAVERFSAENEPELLRYAKGYFSQLTGGEYVTIEHDPNSSPRFCVRDKDLVSYEPKQLSTGTREQLYLAIRMAFIRNHSEHHESLPVLMDDCFVNFDDQRLRNTLNAIGEWGGAQQTILFTCHGRVVKAFAELSPMSPVILLEEGQTMLASEVADLPNLAAPAQ